jgi:DNA-binding SARP family transcriptional activator
VLPRPPEPFLGRQTLIQDLVGRLSDSPLLVIKGLAGIGKTAVTLHLLQKLSVDRPCHYVRLSPGLGLQPLFDELSSECQAAEPRGQVLDLVKQFNAQAGCWVIEDVQVLEDALSVLLIRSLQLYARFPVILTSRAELPLSPVEQVEISQVKLGPIDDSCAVELLEHLLARRGCPAATKEVLLSAVRPLGGHPYLVKLLAAVWNEERSSVGDFLVQEILSGLSEPATLLLQRLALSRVAVAESGLKSWDGFPELTSLIQKFLVEKTAEGYSVPRLVSESLLATLDGPHKVGLHRDLAAVHQAAGEVEAALYHGLEGEALDSTLALLEQQSARLCSQGRYQVLLDCLPRLEALGRPLSPPLLQASSHVLSNLGRWEESLRRLAQLEQVPGYELEAQLSRAGTLLNQGEWTRSLAGYAAILAHPDSTWVMRTKAAHYSILIHAYRGEVEQGRGLLEQHPLPESWLPAHRQRIESVLCHFEQRPERALELAQQALAGANQIHARRLGALCQQALAEALCDLGQGESALIPLLESLDWARRAGDAQVLGFSLLSLGRVYYELGQAVQARQAWEQSELAFLSQGNRNGAAMARLGLLTVEREHGRLDERNWQRCLKAAEECGNPPLRAALLKLQASAAQPVAAPVVAPLPSPLALEVRLLGDLVVTGPLGELAERDWPTRKAAGVFGLLCFSGGKGYSDQMLASYFWPESSQERSRSSLRSALHQVRSSLAKVAGDQVAQGLSRSRKVGTVHLEMDMQVDTRQLRGLLESGEGHYLGKDYPQAIASLQQALNLYRGDFLEKFREDWTDSPREACKADALRVCQLLCLSYLAAKQGEPAEAAARRGLQLDDLSEELHMGLMEALLQQGLRAEALRHYRKTLQKFEDELSLYPRSFDSIFARLVV